MNWMSLLLFLLCPLSMMFMMRGHQHEHNPVADQNAHGHHGVLNTEGTSGEPSRLDAYKIKQLEGEIDLLKNQNEVLQKEVEELPKEHLFK